MSRPESMRTPSALEAALLRTAVPLVSRSGRNAALLVLILHRVLREPDPLLPDEPDAARFTAVLDLLQAGFNVLPLAEAVQRLRAGTLPARAVCVTFDDGYASNFEVALPILASKGVPATVFVAPGFLGGGRMFNDTVIEAVRRAPGQFDLRDLGLGLHTLLDARDRVLSIDRLLKELKYRDPVERLTLANRIAERVGSALPSDLMMSPAQVRKLHEAGVEIGAHTVDHPILARVDDDTARRQITESRQVLAAMIGAPVTAFAYPNGRPSLDYDRRHVTMAREAGFEFAVSTAWGAATRTTDPFQIPRIAPWGRNLTSYAARLVAAYRDRRPALA